MQLKAITQLRADYLTKTLLGLALVGICLFTTPASLMAQSVRTPVNLGTAGNYVVLSQTGITDVPPSTIVGNIGASPITGAAIHVSCAEVTGTISAVDSAGPAPCAVRDSVGLGTAIGDMGTAYADAAGRTVPDFVNLGAGNISGMTLLPGLYKWSTDVSVDNTNVTLSGGPNAVWIFQVAGNLNLASASRINLAGGARAVNVFWQIAGGTGLIVGSGAVFSGTALTATAVILNTGASLNGRALATTAVTLDMSPVTSPGTLAGGLPVQLPPTVTSTTPGNVDTNVSPSSAMTATFSTPMAPATITTATFTVKNGVTAIAGTVSYIGVTATFTPTNPLPALTLLTGTISTGATDTSGVPLAAPYVWSFTTGAAPNTTPPTVSSTVPAAGATNVSTNSTVAITFSEAMNPLTINTGTIGVKQAGVAVAGTVTYAGVTATFTPTANLAASLPFTATVTTGVMDLAGNAMAAPYVWSFTTGAAPDTTPPTVSSTIPATGATGVSVNSAVSITFSEPMNPLTISTANIGVRQAGVAVAGTVTYAGVTATFTPTASFAASSPFTATVTTGVTDLAGNAMAAPYVWGFTTGAAPDTTPPTVSSTIPAPGATNVPVNSALAITFSEAMNPLTITTATIGLKQGGVAVVGTVTYAGVTATFTPTGALAAGVPFTATVTTGVTDLAGNALVAPYVWSFTTAAAIILDTTPPTVSFTFPLSGATNVPVNSAISITFSEAMNPLTINTGTIGVKQAGVTVAGTVTYAGVTATFTPNTNLVASLPFTATVTTGVTDLAGNALVAPYVWSFTTGASADTVAPTVISTLPASGATNVPLNGAVSVTFSEAMNPLTITTASITLKQAGVSVAGTVTYAGVTATFTPTFPLAANLLFNATVTTGVRDLAGNSLVTPYLWSFTTGLVADTTAPTVISTAAGSGSVSVTTSANVVATFSEAVNPLTITTASFLLQQGTTAVPGTVVYAGVTATFVPTSPLLPNTVYTATITTVVTDLAGNHLQSAYRWSFTTGSATLQSQICVVNLAILAGSAIINTGATSITGDIGVSPGTGVSGFPPGTITGVTHAGDAVAAQAMTDMTAAYKDAVSRSINPAAVSGDIGGQTLTPGLYQSLSSLSITAGDLTLDAKGSANAVFIFQAASTLTTGTGRQIILAGGALARNIYWQVGSTATLGNTSVFNGSILANQSVTLGVGATVNGRIAAINGTVTLQSNVVVSPLPLVYPNGTVNGATEGSPVAPGSLIAVFGNDFGSSTVVANSYLLPMTLGGVSFRVGTLAAPLFMTSCGQANVQVPWETPVGSTQIAATAGGQTSLPQSVAVTTFAPGIFTLNQMGTGQGAIEIAPSAQLAAATPVGSPISAGGYIAIFCTGLGPVTNQPSDGAPGLSSPLSTTLTLPVVMIGNVQAQVTYSGLAPTFAGLYQVNAIVPAGVVPGSAVPVTITIGGVQSNSATIAVQ